MRRALFVAIVIVPLLACMLSYTLVNRKEKSTYEPVVCTRPATAADKLPSLPEIRVFTGVCQDGARGSLRYTIAGKWSEETKNAEEYVVVTFGDSRFTGSVKSVCPSNPWTHRVACTAVSMQGDAFRYYRPDRFPLTSDMGK
ncbi:MAG TPA: hypothetical protein VKF36_03650 [Syntrophorhabdales bacterium]|nr:hypothetical protein [Syntrophorhabdales bacterium]